MKRIFSLGAAATIMLFATGASAMPLAPQDNIVSNPDVQNVRLVCRHGHCYRTHRRYVRRGYYGGYYGGPYAYAPRYVAPGFGIGVGPGYYGRPGVGFGFGW